MSKMICAFSISLAIVIVVTSGCGNGDDGSTSEAASFEAFMRALYQEICALQNECCPNPMRAADCEASNAGLAIAIIQPYITSGDVIYHQQCGAAALEWIRNQTCETIQASGQNVIPAEIASSCQDDLFSGTRKAGEQCGSGGMSTDMVCMKGLVCHSPSEGDSLCTEPLAANAACDWEKPDCVETHRCKEGACQPRAVESEQCDPSSYSEECAEGLKCDDGTEKCVVESFCTADQ